jgi:parallel beta-helix repeat protein
MAAACGGVRESAPKSARVLADSPLTPATAHHLFVAPDGADSNQGTEAAPFRSIERAARVAQPDTTVHVAPGTYSGGFKTVANGTPAARVYYVSTMRWGAKIVPPLNSASPTGWDNRGNYVDIVGFDVDGTVYRGGVKWANGIYSGGSYDAIRHNHIHHIGTTLACTGKNGAAGAGIGVDSFFRGVKTEVIGNDVHDIGPEVCRTIHGIAISSPGTVANNIVYRVSEAGIRMWHDANNVIVANNTVSASGSGIVVGGGDFYYTAGPNDNTHVSNNIVFDNKLGILERGATGKNNTYTNNLVFQNPGGDWSLANGVKHNASVASAPQFLNYYRNGTPDFRLSSTSPAIGSGNPRHAQPGDYKGMPRNAATGIDIGAYQH